MEIFDIIEKAKNISEILNAQEESSEVDDNEKAEEDKSNNINDNFSNILNAIQLFKTLNDNKISSQEENQEKNIDKKDKDDFNFEFNNPSINSITKILPLLDFDYQKELVFFVRMMEMKHFINSYKNVVTTASLEQKDSVKRGMLLAIKPKLNIEKQPIVDIFLKFLEMNEIINKMKLKES